MNTNAPASILHRLIGAAAGLALTAGLPGVSHASGDPTERAVTLEFAAAGASTSQGASALYQRIQAAAQYVCSVVDHGDLSSRRNFRNCLQIVIEDAVRKVDRAALTAVFEENYSLPAPQFVAVQQR